MTRYFMTIPEASRLVIQAGALGRERRRLRARHGRAGQDRRPGPRHDPALGRATSDDIEIEFTGLRPGEKLHEELFTDDEALGATRYEQIMVAHHEKVDEPRVLRAGRRPPEGRPGARLAEARPGPAGPRARLLARRSR